MNKENPNYHLLKLHFPKVYEAIRSLDLKDNLEIVNAKNGSSTLKITAKSSVKYIHSAYNPEEEAKNLINSLKLTPDSIPLIIGFGLGYHIKTLIKEQNNFPYIFVFEARPDIFKKAADSIDLSDILSCPKLKLFVTDDTNQISQNILGICASAETKNKLRLIVHQPSLDIYKLGSSELTDIIEKIRISPMEQNLLRENFMSNLSEIIRNPGVNNLFGKFKNMPVFLVSAGPTLSRDLPALKTIKNRGIIICVSTIFSLLIKNNIKPDFVAIGDPKPIMITHFKGLLHNNTPLIFLATAAQEVIKKYTGPKFVALQNNFRMSDIVSQKIDKGRVDVGESISTLILDLAIKTSANPIIFVGQDLAFTDKHTHTKGVSKRIKITHSTRTIKSINGEHIATSSVFYWILHWLEKKISQNPQTAFINTSQTGAHIKGTTPMALEEAIAKYCLLPIDKEHLI